jgi:NADH dehydrogenase
MHIVILGAGYAGLHTALNLSTHLEAHNDAAQITLVDRNLYHQHLILLHLVAAGMENTSEVVLPLDTILRHRAIRFHQGEVARIAPQDRYVRMRDGLALHYDRLVIALGSETNYAAVPGAAEHSWPLYSFVQARRLRDHIRECFQQAAQTDDAATRRTLLTFTVVGGGFTGCQLAGELTEHARQLCRAYGVSSRDVRIALLERKGILLAQFGAWATDEAARTLRQRGVSIHLNMQVERVEERKIVVEGGKVIHTATVIWAAGIRAPQFLSESGLTTDQRGRVIVDSYLRGIGPDQSRIFAVGDCAHIPDPEGGIVASTASNALRQGEHLAQTIFAEMQGVPPRAYAPQRLGALVSLGPGAAVGDPFGVPASGLPVALLKQAVEKWYFTTLW